MRPEVVFTVVFMKDGQYLASPTVLAEFGREVRVEVPNENACSDFGAGPQRGGAILYVRQDGNLSGQCLAASFRDDHGGLSIQDAVF